VIKIVLADDHLLVRQGLRALLAGEAATPGAGSPTPAFSIVAEAADGLETIALVEQWQPNVLIVDLMMPRLTGLEVTRQVSQRWPQIRVVILSMYNNEAYVLEALRNGAAAYVLKESSITDLVQAVHVVIAGQHYLSPLLSERAIESYLQKAKATPLDPYETLTTREREVLLMVAQGYSSSEIATYLSISPRTVETHRTNLMRKLDLRTQADLIRYALQRGILPLQD